ncbi:MAG: hypothetical protein R3F11_09910 [Verrucomicrobiales bacterium]
MPVIVKTPPGRRRCPRRARRSTDPASMVSSAPPRSAAWRSRPDPAVRR